MNIQPLLYMILDCGYQERIMKEGKWREKEHKAPTHLIEGPNLSHAARVTKNENGSSGT